MIGGLLNFLLSHFIQVPWVVGCEASKRQGERRHREVWYGRALGVGILLQGPVEVGSLSHYLQAELYIPQVVGWLPSTSYEINTLHPGTPKAQTID